jgi:isopenicillin N synthase-like dioxygenase
MVVYAAPTATEDIPIIDLSASLSGDDAACRAAAEKVRRACRDTGFFSVIDHGIDAGIIETAFAESKRFFHQPDAWKMQLAKQPGSNGYEPLESQVLDPESGPDLKESFNVTRPAEPGSPDQLRNLWPKDLPGFRENLEAYHRKVQELGLHISRLIALSLGMPIGFFDPTFENQKAALRLLRYPPMPGNVDANKLGAGAHHDFGWITIVAQDHIGGLEVETASGNWIRVDPIPGAFVVNLGDLVTRWTNGVYHSSLHRVINNTGTQDRYSMVLFYNHRYETTVECLPTCLAPGEKPKYPPAVSGELRTEKYLASHSHLTG